MTPIVTLVVAAAEGGVIGRDIQEPHPAGRLRFRFEALVIIGKFIVMRLASPAARSPRPARAAERSTRANQSSS
ncbi:MAG: hypothetical protein R2708_18225 [Vicinamibacterales bacterium]